jgi:segregation and condensation protein B
VLPCQDIAPESLINLVESLLFVADRPTTADQIAKALDVEATNVEQALQQLDQQLVARGIRLQRKGLQVQLVTAPEAAPYIQRFLGLELTGRLTQPALETLAIIAYRQPVTRASLEAIRGVNCDGVLRTLVSRGLVEEVGRLDQAGRPILYGTTFEFMQYFGLQALDELPPLEILDADGPDGE